MADFEAPQSRNEAILQNMLGAENELDEPQSRIEALLLALLDQLRDPDADTTPIHNNDRGDTP